MKIINKSSSISFIALLVIVNGLFSILRSLPIPDIAYIIQERTSPIGENITITQIYPDSPAANAGLQINDSILTINNKTITGLYEFNEEVRSNINNEIRLEIQRQDKRLFVTVIPRDPSSLEGPLGIWISNNEFKNTPLYSLIPNIIFESYINQPSKYTPIQNSYAINNPLVYQTRLRLLIMGIISTVLGLGLITYYKWAFKGYVILLTINTVIAFITTVMSSSENPEAASAQSIIYMSLLISVTINMFVVYHLYKNRHHFK